jgi:hypothetical protein
MEERVIECSHARSGCKDPVTHIDNKGFIYCAKHGKDRQAVRACREIRAWELRVLRAGGALSWVPLTREDFVARHGYASAVYPKAPFIYVMENMDSDLREVTITSSVDLGMSPDESREVDTFTDEQIEALLSGLERKPEFPEFITRR